MIMGSIKSMWDRLLGRRDLTCRDATDFLTAYVDNELQGSVRLAFDRHLAECSWCRTYLETYKQTVEMGKSACRCHQAEAATEMPDELVRAILAATRKGEEKA